MMAAFDDTYLANLPEPRSVEEVAAIALAVDRAAEARCSTLARGLRSLDLPEVATLLEELASAYKDHAERIAPSAPSGGDQDLAETDPAPPLPRILSEERAAVCDLLSLTPYRLRAQAVTLAQQSFQLYSYLAAASDPEVRDYAQRLAGEQLSRAARLRVERRRAYHAARQKADEGYPAAPLVESEADLLAAALAIEDRLALGLAEAGEQDPGLVPACQATRRRVEQLRDAAAKAGAPGAAMAEELARFTHRALTGRDRPAATRRLLADCKQAFSFYDAVASAPADEAVLLQAQDLSQAAVERIRQLRALAETPGEAEDR